MSTEPNTDPDVCIAHVVNSLKANGTFDQFRRDCLTDVESMHSYGVLVHKVEGYVSRFLAKQTWSSSLNKGQLRTQLRNYINESDTLKYGIKNLVDQIVNDRIVNELNEKIVETLSDYLGIKYVKKEDNTDKSNNDSVESKSNDLQISIPEENEQQENNTADQQDQSSMQNETLGNAEVISEDEEFDKISNENDDWPTPPKAELLTPEHESSPSPVKPIIDDKEHVLANQLMPEEMREIKSEISLEILEALKSEMKQENIDDQIDEDTVKQNVQPQFELSETKSQNVEECSPNEEVAPENKFLSVSNIKSEEAATLKSTVEFEELDKKVVLNEETTQTNETSNDMVISKEEEEEEEEAPPPKSVANIKGQELQELSSVSSNDFSEYNEDNSLDKTEEEATNKMIRQRRIEIPHQLSKSSKASVADSDGHASDQEPIEDDERESEETKKPAEKVELSDNEDATNDEQSNDSKLTKRTRKVNPKFAEFSYSKRSLKSATLNTNKPTNTEVKGTKSSSKSSKRKRIPSETSLEQQQPVPDIGSSGGKSTRQLSNKKSRTTTTDQCESFPVEKVTEKTAKCVSVKANNKRYDSSDLYKPRISLSSRRSRGATAYPMTPDSNSNSTLDENETK